MITVRPARREATEGPRPQQRARPVPAPALGEARDVGQRLPFYLREQELAPGEEGAAPAARGVEPGPGTASPLANAADTAASGTETAAGETDERATATGVAGEETEGAERDRGEEAEQEQEQVQEQEQEQEGEAVEGAGEGEGAEAAEPAETEGAESEPDGVVGAPAAPAGELVGPAPEAPERGQIDRRAVVLERTPLFLDPVTAPFHAPLDLRVVPDEPAEELPPGLRDYPEVFAEAAKASARLHLELRRAAEREALALRALADELAGERQRGVGRALDDLLDGLADGLSRIDLDAGRAHLVVDQIAALAAEQVDAAARSVLGTLGARSARVTSATSEQRRNGTRATEWAAARAADVRRQGQQGTAALDALRRDPTEPFPFSDLSPPENWIRAAQNEVIVRALPPVIGLQREGLSLDAEAQAGRMADAARALAQSLAEALRPFDRLQHGFSVTGPRAVRSARRASLSRLRGSAAALHRSIDRTRSSTREALIGQHNQQREMLADGARDGARAEHQALEQRGNQLVGSYDALAASQGTVITAVHDSFRQHRAKPEEEFAGLVRVVSERTRQSASAMAEEKQAAAGRDASRSRTASRRQTATTIERLGTGAARGAEAINDAAEQTGEALLAQAEAAYPGFMALAEPVLGVLAQYPIPLQRAFAGMIRSLTQAVGRADGEVRSAYSNPPSQSGPPQSGAAQQGTTRQAPNATEATRAFVERARGIARAPETGERTVRATVERVDGAVATNIGSRRDGLYAAFQPIDVEAEAVFAQLRGLTANRGGAVEHSYNTRYRSNLVEDIRWNLNVGDALSGVSTRVYNIRAALRYLRGDVTGAAQYELRSATEWWNDSRRVDRVMLAMSPEQMQAFDEASAANQEFMADVRGDLGETDRAVYDHLRRREVGAAQSIRMQEDIDRAREQRGDRGADATADVIRRYREQAGRSRLEGSDEFALGEQDFESAEDRDRRREEAWRGYTNEFATRHPVEPAEGEMGPVAPGEALIRYATREMDYQVYVPDEHGEGGHYETRREGLRSEQDLLIRNLVTHGPDSAEARAAQLLVERTRAGGAKHERVRQAVDDPALNPAFDLDLVDPNDTQALREAQERAATARREQARMYQLLDQYAHGDEPNRPERSVDAIRSELGDELQAGARGDAHRGRYLRAMVTHDLHEREVAVAAFEYGTEGAGTREEVLEAQFGSMSREQIDDAVAEYDRTHDEPLYDRLGIHGRGGTFTELSGDEANRIQVLSMGRPRNDRERFEVAAMTSRLQQEDSTWVGRALAGDAAESMQRSYARMLRTAGIEEAEFDELGRLRVPGAGEPIPGQFDERGNFVPRAGQNRWDLAADMISARVTADAYRAATDSIANAITTAIVMTAAVVTTALTGGAAASIWIPVLVTMGAGVAAMGVNYAIKGGRYGYEQAATDLAMTVVQAATAGAGAAAGAYLRGGSTALRAVSSRLAVSEKVLERFMAIGGRGGLRALGLTDELLIGGLTGAAGAGGAALLDDRAWDGDEYGQEFGHALVRGLLSGVVGAGAMRPFSAAAQRSPANAAMLRGLGSGLGGAGSRAAELGYERERGKYTGSLHDALNSIRDAGAQGTVQGFAEAAVENLSDTTRLGQRVQRRMQRARPFRRARPAAAPRPSERPPAATRRPPDPTATQADLEMLDAVATAVRLGFEPTEVLPPNVTPERPAVPPAPEPARPVPPLAGEEPPGTIRPGELEGEPTVETRRPTAADEDEPTLRMRRPPAGAEEEAAAEPRRAAEMAEEEVTEVMERPRGLREDADTLEMERPPVMQTDEPELLEVLPEMTGVMTADPTDAAETYDLYGKMVRDSPDREVAVYYNPVTGEYVTFQGVETTVFVQERGGEREAPLPAGQAQRWKELLDTDLGYWVLDSHYHPARGDSVEARLADRLPSGGGGDFSSVTADSAWMGGAARRSRIHVLENGEWKHTDFGIDPGSTDARYWVEFENPATGRRERREFGSIGEYEAWRDEAIRPPGAPLTRDTRPDLTPITTPSSPITPKAGGRLSPAPEGPEVTLWHGTTRDRMDNIELHGVSLEQMRGAGRGDDFGKAFYLTIDRRNAQTYASRRAAQRGGEPHVQEFHVPLHELGTVLDVRPGGAHRQLWEQYLDRRMFWPGMPEGRPIREVIDSFGVEARGTFFESFLQEQGLRPDIVWGDLGGVGTIGISAGQGGEQIAIRTQQAADRLNQALRAQGVPVPPSRPVTPRAGGSPRTTPEADPMAPSQARRRAEIDEIVGAVRDRRGPEDADRLREMLILGGEDMERLVHAPTEEDMARHMRALAERLGSGVAVDPARRDALIDLVARRRARSFPQESERMLRSRARRLVERWERTGLRPGEVRALMTEIGGLYHDRTAGNFGFGTARKKQMEAEEWAVEEALFFPEDDPDASPLRRYAEDIRDVDRLAEIMRDRRSGLIRRFARGSLVGDSAAEWDLVAQWHGYLASIERFNAQHPHARRPVTAEGFDNFLRGYMRRTQIPRFSEVLAATELAGPRRGADMGGSDAIEMDLELLKWALEIDPRPDVHTSRNEPNEPGSDILGYRRQDDTVVYADDKAWSATRRNEGEIDRVGALTQSLSRNMADDAAALDAQFTALRAAGFEIDPDHARIPGRLRDCAAEIEQRFPNGIKLNLPGHAERLAEITRRHGIELAVTNAAERGASDVSDTLKRAGFRFLRTSAAPRE